MIRNLLSLSFFILLLTFLSCGDKTSQKISGTFKGLENETVILEESDINQNIFIDSTTTDKHGSFKLKAKLHPEKLYTLKIQNAKIPIIYDGKDIHIDGTWPNWTNLKVTGSSSTANINNFIKNIVSKNENIGRIIVALDSLNYNNAPDSIIALQLQKRDNAINEINTYVKTYANKASHPQEALLAATMINNRDEAFFQNFVANLNKRFPESQTIKNYVNLMGTKILNDNKTLTVGSMAPDFTLKDKNGKEVSLSDLKGKYVLLDFWGSFCPPCRRENPNIANAYNRFKTYNFEIVSVSLDQDKNKWLQAISDDKMTWINLNDEQEWSSPLVELYGFDVIPTNYLINPEGKIIQKNIFGNDLSTTLMNVLTNAKDKVEAQPL